MEKPRNAPSHHRLRELLAIPERQRTDAQWAEINELEITLTPINRAVAGEQNPRRKATVNVAQPKPREGAPVRQSQKKPRKRLPPRGAGRL